MIWIKELPNHVKSNFKNKVVFNVPGNIFGENMAQLSPSMWFSDVIIDEFPYVLFKKINNINDKRILYMSPQQFASRQYNLSSKEEIIKLVKQLELIDI